MDNRADADEPPGVVFGFAGRDYVAIRVLGRLNYGASDYWDGNWLTTLVDVKVGDFVGQVVASLRTEELRTFRKSLANVNASVTGEAVLTSLEPWITVRVTARNWGHIVVTGCLNDHPGGGNQLSFTIDGLDVTYLPTILESLENVEALFPVIGLP